MKTSPEMKLVHQVAASYQNILGNNLVGVYVHGSLAFGCFRWDHSDIDLLVAVAAEPSLPQKEAMIQVLLDLTPSAPPKGFEMSVLLAKDCRHFRHPLPFVLHFSNSYLAQCRQDLTAYCQAMHGADPDLAAHLTVLHAAGFAVCGPAVSELFDDVPAKAYWDSLWYDTQDAAEHILQDPVYVILNLCRVLAYAKEGLILSKEQGGAWGVTHLAASHVPLVKKALAAYTQDQHCCFSADQSAAFAADLLEEIKRLHESA